MVNQSQYINDEFMSLESKFDEINSNAELHKLIDELTVYIEELDKQKDLTTISDVRDELKDRQDFTDDVITYVNNAIQYTANRLSDENIIDEFRHTLFKHQIVQFKNSVNIYSQFDEEDFGDLEILADDYVIVKDKKLTSLAFSDLADMLNDYLTRI